MDLTRALAIIDEAAEVAFEVRGPQGDVVEALRFLSNYGIERETLKWFWRSLDSENDIGRSQNVNASRNRIRWLLKQRGR